MRAVVGHGEVTAVGPSEPAPVAARTRWVCCAVCFAAGVIAFWPTLFHPFVYDDHPIVSENWIVRSPDAWYRFLVTSYWPPRNASEKRPAGGDKLYRPLTIGSFRLGCLLHGHRPIGYHATNIILHGITSLLVCALAFRVWRSVVAALVAGLLFAVHPIHADAVAPVVGRSEILAGLFCAWLLLRYARPISLTGTALARFHVVSTLLFAAAVCSKEHALFVWPALVALEWYLRHRQPAGQRAPLTVWLGDLARQGHLGFAYVTTVFFFMRFYIFGMHYRRAPDSLPFWANPLAAADVQACLLTPFRLLWLTVRQVIDPSCLSPLWNPNSLMPAENLREPDVWAGILVAAAAVGLIVWGLRRGRTIGLWVLVFALFMVLPLHVVPMASWFFAERWLYLPTVALAMVLAGLVRPFGRRLALAGVCVTILLLPYTWSYAAAWRSDESMNRYVLREHPDNFHAANNLAVVYLVEKRYEEALRVAGELADRFPDAWQPHRCMSEAYAGLGNPQRAKEEQAAADMRQFSALLQMR
jgi:hypothetical protein